MSYFTIKSKEKLSDLPVGRRIEESDFATLTPDGVFVQLEHHETDDEVKPYAVKPGVWSIQKSMSGLVLETTSFVKDSILDSFVRTKEITDKIDCFFRKLHIYKKHGFEVPKRGILLYGPPGSGKSTAISKVIDTYNNDQKTAVIIWTTDKFESYQVKDFIKSFDYKDVEKMILVVEDIGGVEIDQTRMKSDSSLLSLLDNQEKTFKIPVLILATTNFPEVFLGNLTNRPQRFDDKIEVGFPSPDERAALYKFYNKEEVPEEGLKLIKSDKCNEFSPAHVKEIIIRSEIYEKQHDVVIKEMLEEIERYKKAFSKQKSMGFDKW